MHHIGDMNENQTIDEVLQRLAFSHISHRILSREFWLQEIFSILSHYERQINDIQGAHIARPHLRHILILSWVLRFTNLTHNRLRRILTSQVSSSRNNHHNPINQVHSQSTRSTRPPGLRNTYCHSNRTRSFLSNLITPIEP